MSFLSQYDAAPNAEKFALARKFLDYDTHPFCAELRASRPIFETERGTMLALFDDCIEVLRQPKVFSVALYEPKMGDFMLSQDDVPSRYRDKGIMQGMLNREDLPRVRKMIGDATAAALDAAGGKIEAVEAIGRGVPIKIVQDYFGFEGVDPKKLQEWSFWNQMDAFHNQPFDVAPNSDEIVANRERALEEMKQYIIGLITQRVGEIKAGKIRDDNIVSRVLQTQFSPGVGFDMARAVINIGGLLIGAVETTSQAVIQAAAQLVNRPDELPSAQAAATTGPDDFDGYAWEALRFHPISPYMFRVCERDTVIARGTDRECQIAKGTMVLPLVGSAMMDPRAFPDPETFRATRPLENTFHLGWGHHECLGKYVALVMIPEIVRQIMLREDLSEAAPMDYKGGPFPEEWVITYKA